MKLSKKELQELKNKTLQIEDLDEAFFIESENSKNILNLLNNNVCSFKEIVDKFESIEDYDGSTSLYKLFTLRDLLKDLIESNRISNEDVKYLFDSVKTSYEITRIERFEDFFLRHLIDNKIVSFREIVDKYKQIRDHENTPALIYLLGARSNFKYWIDDKLLTQEDLKYLFDKVDRLIEFV